MDEPIIVRMSGKNGSLTTTFSPVINVHGSSEIALVCLRTSSDKILIDGTNNSMRIFDTNLDVKIAEGYYTISDIENYITNVAVNYGKANGMKAYFRLTILDDKCRVTSNFNIDFNVENSLANVLGFEKKKYHGFNQENLNLYYHESEKVEYKIKGSGSIKVLCNIAKGALDNGQQSHSIYEFFSQPTRGKEIVESPNNLIYYKLKTAVIKKIKIDLVDENNNPIKNSDGQLTIILHIRPIKS